MSRSFDHLTDIVEAVGTAEDIDDALADMVRLLRDAHALWTAAVFVYSERHARIVASWIAAEDHVWQVGTEIALDLTGDVRKLTEALTHGRPLISRPNQNDLGILGDWVQAQGISSAMMIPLMDGEVLGGSIIFGSASPDGFTERHIPFFTGVAKGTEDRILTLARRSGR